MREFWCCAVIISLLAFGCDGSNKATDEDLADKPACSDGIDNDADGMTDFPDDLSCSSAGGLSEDGSPAPQCSDGRDNDGDGKTDYPADPGCFVPQADDETDNCPDGDGCPQCANGQDDDQNGAADYPADPACESAADATEFLNVADACGAGLKIKQLPADGTDLGTLEMASRSMIVSPCGGGLGAAAIAYVVHLTSPKVLVATTDLPGTVADTVIDIRGQMFMQPSSELACNADISTTNNKSTVAKSLPAGVYYIIVQGQNPSALGAYQLRVDRLNGEGTTCTGQDDCGPGLCCRVPHGQTAMVCAKAVCNDGLDDDGDGKIDYPNDPGCATTEDDSETDTCPGAGCPECGDGIDNDSDTKIDYPLDTTCKAAADSSESCATTEGVIALTSPITTGTTAMAANDYQPTCALSTGTGKDHTYRLDIPAVQSLALNVTGFDTVTALLGSTCSGTALACSDPPLMTVGALAAGTYYFVVDAYSSGSGAYTLTTSGVLANGAACDAHPLTQSGALTCGSGYACKGTTGAKTCQVAQCNDTMDNNGNGKVDYPADPGCTSPSDDTETTVCPGAQCPVCSNGIDDDMDGMTDYPADSACIAASSANEACVSVDPVAPVTMAATTATTVGAANDTRNSCSLSTGAAPDVHHQLDLPAMSTVTIGMSNKTPAGWDATMALLGATCSGTAIQCEDAAPETITRTNLAAGRYYVVVDGRSNAAGAYTLNVSGKIANGGSCEVPLAQSGALACDTGYTCKGATGSKTCQKAQCSDGLDNNNAGGIDYPFDPGCASPADDTETTVCPGASCPTCANGTDDDTDTLTDFPTDFGCSAASAGSEVFCAGEPDSGMTPITTLTTAGTLAGKADNYDQTCQPLTGNDMAFALQLPVPVASLVIDTDSSTAIDDTVVSLKDASCGVELGCDDDAGGGFLSKLTVTNVRAGNYAIQVDGYDTMNNGAFVLKVQGTVAAQTSCTSPLFAANVLVCPTGTTCTGTPKKCQ